MDNSMAVWLPAPDEISTYSTASSTPNSMLQPFDVSSNSLTNDMTTGASPQEAPRRRPVPGRGFRKTRRGCFNCKRRRVKCSEHRPECLGCRRMSLDCVYPACVLPDPRTIPSAPTYEFLASSILALAAQHLTVFNKADYSVQALGLRISAIKGLNDALSQPCRTAADADARYAAIIGLTFQSSYMPDGLMEFVAMMRGWMVISTTLVTDPRASMFRQFTRESYVESIQEHVKEQYKSRDDTVVEGFLASLRIL
ncbi:hypothetical protein FSARC_13863 [Fusarium sarcochroum]|uniref:Zn(2)-C6 fungal-type domain-containing protein n=1 Tax=Fusarium sarcochroum TaxID=1208366 RepID=A0A8H4SYC3_9HYPO|nr:hypothetical protein FSARC_13863 [Fusarium sarcochroum]